MRLGVIDVGSNTVHLLVVDAHLGAHPLPAYSHKIELRLSEYVADGGRIAQAGADRLVEFVRDCLTIADDHGVEDLLAFATSAIREAPNGEAVLSRVHAETGTELQVLSGPDEARLTFLAVRRWFGWSSGRLLVVDIGGGRLTRDWLPGDPPEPGRLKELRTRVRADIARSLRDLTKAGTPHRAVGTSKTLRSLARILGAAPSTEGPYAARGLERAGLADLVPRLTRMTLAERQALPGVSPGRASQLLAGAVVAAA